MSDRDHAETQRAFYARRPHHHLRPRAGEAYAENLAAKLASATGMTGSHRVLELGAGFGRFTFPLLAHCASVTALDLSGRVLRELERTRDERGIDAARCRTLCCDVDALPTSLLRERFDFVVGFFFLHHLPDCARTLASLAPLAAPGGRVAFVEPNRWNPLFLLQVACCPDMTWREEKGMFRLSRGAVERAYARAGLEDVATRTFGLFPPPIVNRSALARRIETRVEGWRWLRGLLPFLLLSARAPAGPASTS